MPAIDFQTNEFRTYEVKVEGLSLGFINTDAGGYTPSLGEKIQYDGNTVILKDGRQFSDVPQLRTAILTSNWLVPVGEKATKKARPKSANIKVTPTQTQAGQRPVKQVVQLETSDEREVVSVANRQKNREAANLEATRRVPLESLEARNAMISQENPRTVVTTGDDEVDDFLSELSEEIGSYESVNTAEIEHEEVEEDQHSRQAAFEARIESDVLEMLEWAESDAGGLEYVEISERPKSARQLPVDMQDDRKTLPLVREDPSENAGTVVSNVSNQKRTVIEREEEIALNVAQAKPPQQSSAPSPRLGGAGAVVIDEQRDMGTISLSGDASPIRLDESVKVTSSNRESIHTGEVQVGRKKAASTRPPTSVEGGVAVGRVLSPATRTFVASDSNTSSTAIQRAQEGKLLRVERFETDEEVVGNVSDGAPATAKATGDVEEATSGDSLEEMLPNAATPPKPEVHRRPEEDPAYTAVKMLIPDFEWDKDRPVKVRVQAALKYLENPQYVKGILAVETELAREEIKKALAAELERRVKAKKAAQEPEKGDEG